MSPLALHKDVLVHCDAFLSQSPSALLYVPQAAASGHDPGLINSLPPQGFFRLPLALLHYKCSTPRQSLPGALCEAWPTGILAMATPIPADFAVKTRSCQKNERRASLIRCALVWPRCLCVMNYALQFLFYLFLMSVLSQRSIRRSILKQSPLRALLIMQSHKKRCLN